MVEPTNAEKELRQAAKVDPKDDQQRQDFLASLTRAVSKLSDDEIDQLSSSAQDWYDQAVDAVNNKATIPEIGDEGPIYDNVPTENAVSDEGEAEQVATEEVNEPVANGNAEQTDLEDATKAVTEDTPAKAPAKDDKPAKGKSKGSGSKSKAKAPSGAKTASGGKSKNGAQSKASKAKGETKQTKATGGNKDKFGCVVGSRRSKAAKMFEKGATMGEVREHFGGNLTFYNLLNKLKQSGHKVEKTEDKKIKLTHKDDA